MMANATQTQTQTQVQHQSNQSANDIIRSEFGQEPPTSQSHRKVGDWVQLRNLTSDYRMVIGGDRLSIGRVVYKVAGIEPQAEAGKYTVLAKVLKIH